MRIRNRHLALKNKFSREKTVLLLPLSLFSFPPPAQKICVWVTQQQLRWACLGHVKKEKWISKYIRVWGKSGGNYCTTKKLHLARDLCITFCMILDYYKHNFFHVLPSLYTPFPKPNLFLLASLSLLCLAA